MIDILWMLIASAMVFMMQAGFVCLESGLVRNKNSINVAAKNFMDMCVSGTFFWLFGYAIMFGLSENGWYGTQGFLFGTHESARQIAFFLFQMMFCGTATTIVSGAVAERMSFKGYMATAAIVAGIIYPLAGHWVWAGMDQGQLTGWLGRLGFIDFAGSTVVHSVGGWVALAAVLIIGPRLGRFGENSNRINASNLPLSVLGVMLLWFGWFGFNGGSTLSMNEQVPGILLNTCLAAFFGGLSAVLVSWVFNKQISIISGMNGVLGGLVGITASCHLVAPFSAALIGVVAGLIVVAGSLMLCKLSIDDAIDAVPVHLFAGIWGSIAVALFADNASFQHDYGLWQQLQVQLAGIAVVGLFSFSVGYALLYVLNRCYSLRVSMEAEYKGLNIIEHGASTDTLDLLMAMEQQRKHGEFDRPVAVEPYTEAGQIASQYNFVMHRAHQEIVGRERALDELKVSESRKGAFLKASLDCIVSVDKHALIQEFNPAAEMCFGFSRRHMMGRNFIEYFVLSDDRISFEHGLKNGFAGSCELVLNRRNKTMLQRIHEEAFPVEITITQVSISEHSFDSEYTFHIRDVTRQLLIQNELKKLAYQDGLTGLHNRTAIRQKLLYILEQSREAKKKCVLMFLDIDRFKLINDSLGHKIGDDLLRIVAQRLQQVVGDDGMVSRWGGDEFVVVFTELQERPVIVDKARQLLEMMRQTVTLAGNELYVLTSIGIAVTDSDVDVDQLIRRADIAMYKVKEAGGDHYRFFRTEMEKQLNNQLYYKTELYHAIEKNQFQLMYQPKVDSKTGKILAFEALLRWKHPKEGEIKPDVFIPILEQSTLIIEVSEWVIKEVCKQISTWKKAALPILPIAINLSGKYFLNADFYDRLKVDLNDNAIQGDLLEFELTETVLAHDTEQCIQMMRQLKTLGVKFSVDDFGTGYSSMSYLKKFPIDTLKIDRSFIEECDSNLEDAAICSAIIALGKTLGLRIVAEGVEKKTQLDFICKVGCDECQGYYFYKPLTVSSVDKLLQEMVIKQAEIS